MRPLLVLVALCSVVTSAAAQEASAGKEPYDRWCAGCHGVEGNGAGPAAGTMLPRPRDFTSGLYQIRSTASGALPTDEDLAHVIDQGMPGTAMPGWRDNLSADDRSAVIEYIKSFSSFFERQQDPLEPVDIGDAPDASEEAIAEGREFYEKIECWKCHGAAGRGNGPSAPTLEDDQGFAVRAADLSENWNFNGGGTTEDIMRRLMVGLNGTPMPSFADLIDAEFMTREQLWHVAQYVRSLSPEEAPAVREVVRAARLVGEVPTTVDDPAWEEAERYYIPLVGQIIAKPRWFAPTVDEVWVQALHNDREIAIRFVWHDPSKSPDPEWDEWTARVGRTIDPEPGSPDSSAQAGAAVADSMVPAVGGPGNLPDMLAIQFPTRVPEGMERPYFLMGDDREPVYLWLWSSDGSGVQEAVGRGLGVMEPMTATLAPAAAATYDEGEWSLVIVRPLASGEVEHRLAFETGRPIPIALFAWDGSNGESDTQGSISTWYFLHLDRPTSPTVYIAPLLATLLTATLGVVVVVRAQRRARGGGSAGR